MASSICSLLACLVVSNLSGKRDRLLECHAAGLAIVKLVGLM